MQLIDGKAISELVKQEIAAEVAGIVAKGGKRPHLAAILVGHDGGSETYVAAKVKACEVCGFKSSLIRYEAASCTVKPSSIAPSRATNTPPCAAAPRSRVFGLASRGPKSVIAPTPKKINGGNTSW